MTPHVDHIKDEFRAASTLAEVDQVSRTYGAEVLAMRGDKELAEMAIQIINLAGYMRSGIKLTQGARR